MSNVRVSDFRANLGRVEREGSPSVLGRLYLELRKVIRSQTHKDLVKEGFKPKKLQVQGP